MDIATPNNSKPLDYFNALVATWYAAHSDTDFVSVLKFDVRIGFCEESMLIFGHLLMVEPLEGFVYHVV